MISWMLVQAHLYIRKKKTCPLAKHIPAWNDSNQLLTHISYLGHLEGEQPYLGDLLTMVINHLHVLGWSSKCVKFTCWKTIHTNFLWTRSGARQLVWWSSNQGIAKLVGICWDDEPTDSNQEFVWTLCTHGPPKQVWWKLDNMCFQNNTDLLSTCFANSFTHFFLGANYPSYPFLANIRKISPVAVAHHNFQSGITWYRYLPFIYPRNCYP